MRPSSTRTQSPGTSDPDGSRPSASTDRSVTDSLRIPLAVLRRRADPRRLDRTVVLDDLRVGGVSILDGRVELSLEAEARGAEVVVTGALVARWAGECRRCLEPLGGRLDLRVNEVMAATGSGTSDEDASDAYPLDGDDADLEAVVRDALLLALPISPLCDERCTGPDPERFPATGGPGDVEAGPVGDPRWAVLDVLRGDDGSDAG